MLNESDPYSLSQQVLALSRSKDVAKVIEAATGAAPEGNMDLVLTLAYLLGQMAGLELDSLSASKDESKFIVLHFYESRNQVILIFYLSAIRLCRDSQSWFLHFEWAGGCFVDIKTRAVSEPRL